MEMEMFSIQSKIHLCCFQNVGSFILLILNVSIYVLRTSFSELEFVGKSYQER